MFDITFTIVVLAVVRMYLQVFVNGQLPIESLMKLPNASKEMSEVISNITALKGDSMSFQLHFIYDTGYRADALRSLADFPVDLKGTTMTTYDLAKESLGWILTPVADRAMVVLFCAVDQALQLFQLIKEKKLRDTITSWIIVLSSSMEETWLHQGLQNLVLEGTNIVVISRTSLWTYRISVSRVDVDGATRFNQIISTLNTSITTGHLQGLDPKAPFFLDNQILYSDLKGRSLKVTANPQLLYAHLGPADEEGVIYQYSGIEFSVLKTLGKQLNFSFVVMKSIDGSWGTYKLDGTATGMIGMVYRREVDLALPLISITNFLGRSITVDADGKTLTLFTSESLRFSWLNSSEDRSKGVDYTTPYLYEPKAILSRAPSVKASPFIIFSPFTSEVWLCLIAMTLITGSVLQILSKTAQASLKQKPLGSLQETIYNTFRSIVNQGELLSHDTPWTLRMTIYSWYLFCIVILAHYSGTLVSMLAIPSLEKPIDSLTDLPKAVSEGFTIGATRGTYIVYIFKDAKDGIYRDTWLLFNHNDLSKSLVDSEEGFNLVTQKKFAFINVRSVIEAEAIMRGRENYHVSREAYYGTWVGLVMTKGAPYKANFDRLVFQMIEGGLINKWKSDEHRLLEKKKVEIEGSGPKAMKIRYLQAAFYVLLLGDLVATAAFASERII